jgi:predicted alpha-1,2-mannosidase
MKNFLAPLFAAATLAFTSCGTAPVVSFPEACYTWTFDSATSNVAQYVDPFIGTGGHGHTYPGATAPFGMVQLSPDTRIDGSWDGCSGYHYEDKRIYGFSHTHLSGTGCSDYGDILLMPGHGAPQFEPGSDSIEGYSSTFSHETEHASAGYYSVALDNEVLCELTASPRVGVHRYTYNDKIDPWIVLDMSHRDEVLECDFEVVDDHTIRGKRFSKAWAENQQLWFYAEFSEPFTYKLYSEGKEFTADSAMPNDLKVVLSFTAQQIEVKLALSPVSSENAKLNLDVETSGMNFNAVKAKTEQHWNSELSCIEIETSDEAKKTVFYTALYHCFVAPNVYCDVNGDYQGFDHNVYRDTVHQRYSVFSLWDTHRALHPLFTIVQQKRTNDFISTFLQIYKESGRLPVWELSSNETDCMIGNHSIPVIADAWMKGITGYDTALAYEAMRSAVMGSQFGLEAYRNYGYVPAEGESESVSRTLEYAYDDWCVAQIAARMNNTEDAKEFMGRASNWRNLLDPETNFFRARMNNGFISPFRADEVNFHYTEANAWQYSMAVQHDIARLADQHYGGMKFGSFLDSLFTVSSGTTGREQADITGLIGQYAHGNEPSHHMAYLYNYAGRPARTQQLVTQITNELYTDQPDGLCGNEDCGQMSAWYVLTTMGIYPVNPCGGVFDYGIPQADRIFIHLENGHTVQITKGDTLSRDSIYSPQLLYSDLLAVDEVRIPQYADTTLTYTGHLRSSAYADLYRLPAPVITDGASRTFNGQKTIELVSLHHGTDLYYSVNDGGFERYTKPFTITENTEIRTYAVVSTAASYMAAPSDTALATFFKAPAWKSIAIRNAYRPQYAAGGDRALIDGLTGTTNFRTGLWQGYEGDDLDVLIDLGKETDIESVSINFLHDQKSWIFLPENVEVWFMKTEKDTGNHLIWVRNHYTPGSGDPFIQQCEVKGPAKARYVRVVGVNRKTCPDGHPGEGKPAWLFADEITIKTK